MFPYFKGYAVATGAIAVALPVIVSTIWPLFTGQIMASTLGGLALLFILFIAGLMIGYFIFSRKADSKVQAMLDAYNDDCDPDKLINEGASIVSQISYPCNQAASWFMGYYAQALLDVGNPQAAKNVLGGLRLSIDSAKKIQDKAGILVNYLPLVEKMEGVQSALSVIEEGLGYCKQLNDGHSEQYREYLDSQKKIFDDLASPDADQAVSVCESIRNNDAYPMRLRVEYSWMEASRLFGHANRSKEVACLKFVADNGNKLAMVAKAKARLQEL